MQAMALSCAGLAPARAVPAAVAPRVSALSASPRVRFLRASTVVPSFTGLLPQASQLELKLRRGRGRGGLEQGGARSGAVPRGRISVVSAVSGVDAMKKVLVAIADGTEEMEAVIAIDVLRRAGADVTVASVGPQLQVTASRKVRHLSFFFSPSRENSSALPQSFLRE